MNVNPTYQELEDQIVELQKQNDNRLNSSIQNEQIYHSLFENMEVGLARCQMLFENNQPIDFIDLEVNRAFEKLNGLKNVVGKSVSKIIVNHKNENPELFNLYERVSNTGISEKIETFVAPLEKWFSISVYSSQKSQFLVIFDNITGRKQAELALFESEEHAQQNNELLRSIMESPKGMIIFSLDPQYRYTSFTISHKETMKYIWGVDIKVGMNMLDIIQKDGDREKAKHNFDLALRGEHLILIEEYGADDLYRTWWENRYSPIYSDTNTIVGLTVFVADITKRKQAEEIKSIQYEIIRIVLSTKNLSEFYEAVRGALGRIINVENFYVAFYDEKTDQLSAVFEKDKKDQIPSWPSGKSLTGRVIKEQKPLILKKAEILNLTNTGEIELIGTRAEAWLGVPLLIGGKVSGALVVQDYDNPQAYNQSHLELLEMVSTEMSICIELKQTEEALKQRESILTAIFESTEDGLLVVDNNGKTMHKNTNFNKMWHIPSKLINYTDDTELLDFVLSQLSEPNLFMDKVKELYKSSKSDHDFVHFKDGRIFERRSNPLLEQKTLKGRVWSFNDITKRKLAEIALKKSEIQLRELSTTKDELYSIIAHDLRSPFNSILGFSDLLMDIANLRDIDKTLKYSTLINTTAQHTLNLLDNLLNWEKSQTGKINFKQENVVLKPIIQEILDTLNSTAILKNISLNQIQSDDIEVYADENILKTILRNLISNAIKFTKLRGHINVCGVSIQDHVEISISDNGIGMNEEKLKELFNISSNATSLGTANERGSGLGLVLCKEFVEKLDGNIWVESELGKGSDFKFTLPLRKNL